VAVRVFDRSVRLGRPRRLPHLADAAAGPAFCSAAGVLQRAAFGPREAAPKKPTGRRTTTQVDPRAGVVVKAASWLRDNL
jgi:cell division protein FtsA